MPPVRPRGFLREYILLLYLCRGVSRGISDVFFVAQSVRCLCLWPWEARRDAYVCNAPVITLWINVILIDRFKRRREEEKRRRKE
jgi:hypothetical protein